MRKVKTAIIGTGNIGTDLLIKMQRSEFIECVLFAGRNYGSKGIEVAQKMGIPVAYDSIQSIINDPSCCDIVFDATSAKSHLYHSKILKDLGKFAVDLTPSRVGKLCIPVLNLEECLNVDNVNLVTCGGQAATPIACAIMKAHPDAEYIEVVASISSKSAGAGTRENVDEYTQTTRDALRIFSGAKKTKAMIVLNPAEPPIIMHNTIYAIIKNPDIGRITAEINAMVSRIKEYVPGYNLKLSPVEENGRVTTMVEVIGHGDYLPKYSGNLDIITCAALKVAEEFAKRKIAE